MTPHGLNLAPVNYWLPSPYRDQALVGQRGRASASTATILVPFSSQSHNYTLVTDPSVKALKVAGVSVPIVAGRATFDAVANPGHGTTVALGTKDDPPISIIRTDWLADDGLFAPDFLDRIAGSSVLRFMDWGRTNAGDPTAAPFAWTPADAPSFAGIAVPIEHMAAACNAVGADAWFNVRSDMTMDEALRCIRLLRSLLLPWLTLHVEWSNEVWNTARGFLTGRYAMTLPEGAKVYYGQRCADLAKALAALGLPRTDMILCWQWAGSASGKQQMVDAFIAAGGPMSIIYGFGFAPYPWTSPADTAKFAAAKDTAGLLAALEANRVQYAPKFAECVALAAKYGKAAVRYEEALSPFTSSAADLAFVTDALNAPEAGAIMQRLWASADAAGMDFGCFYNSASTAPFGFALDYDCEPYPQGARWADHNRRAWPMMRSQMPTKPDYASLASDIAEVQKRLAGLQGRIAAEAVG